MAITDPETRERGNKLLGYALIIAVVGGSVVMKDREPNTAESAEAATSPAQAGEGIPYADAFNATAELGIDPRLVAAVSWKETGNFAPDVMACERTSPDGALGPMQLMPETADELEVDPCNPEQAISGGARYLMQQYESFGAWPEALAAYNAGPGAVRSSGNQIPQNGQTEDYVPAVLAQWEHYKQTFPDQAVAETTSPTTPDQAGAEATPPTTEECHSWSDNPEC